MLSQPTFALTCGAAWELAAKNVMSAPAGAPPGFQLPAVPLRFASVVPVHVNDAPAAIPLNNDRPDRTAAPVAAARIARDLIERFTSRLLFLPVLNPLPRIRRDPHLRE